FEFERAFSDLPLAYKKGRLTVGPIRSFLGQYIQDGKRVDVELKSDSLSRVFKILTIDGYAALDFIPSEIPFGDYEVTASLSDLESKILLTYE
ncbi:MAG: hypothetical protein AAFN93_29310, partial [Bacteroidota bacterium]